MRKIISSILITAVFTLFNGISAAAEIIVKLPDNNYYDAAQYIEFDESTPVYNTQSIAPEKTRNVLTGSVVKIAKGTSFDVFIQEEIDTAYAEVGEDISAMVKEDFLMNNSIVVPQGSYIKGKVVSARHAGRAGQNGKVSIVFNKLELPEGEVYNIKAEQVDFEVSDEGTIKSSALTAAGAIVLGAAAGSVLTHSSAGDYIAKTGKDYIGGAAAGAIITSAVVVGYMLLRKGKDATIPQYSEISVVLEDPLDIAYSDKY